ncbi:hypothetical protein DFH07DRAFT_1058074 [Mycena maculata]|uniref:F-box domain-containing protein n=1 Tax=Mycena maculata TaxID=230809 RepID=A0AAD7JRB2_9AGAR|nr:hypothetical protein DFH07DRAFT_1058074 [Mycena maculata]
MPPRRSRRLKVSPEGSAAPEVPDAPKPSPTDEPDPNAGLALVQLPAELFDAIIDNYWTIPPKFYFPSSDVPALKYYERTDALTALSQTCRALRNITLHRLWARLDISRVPERARLSWYKYVMPELQRKANGIVTSPVRHHVRILTLMLSKNSCYQLQYPGLCEEAKLELPNVTTLFLRNNVSVFQRICPNAVHIRCVGGSGAAPLSGLTARTERVDGPFDWTDMKLVEPPNLRTLGIRTLVHASSIIDEGPAEWAQAIPKLALLKKLSELILTLPGVDETPNDVASIAATRTLMRTSTVAGERRLVIRRVLAPHFKKYYTIVEDFLHSLTTETFE